MICQGTRILLVLLSMMIIVTQFSKDSLVVAQTIGVAQSSCPKCENKATAVDTTLSIIGCLGSALVVVYPPWVRVTKWIDGGENIVKDRWFMAFLGIVTYDYIIWIAYSFHKCLCDARIYMIISSIVGAVVSGLYFLISLVIDIGHIINPVVLRYDLHYDGPIVIFKDNVNGYLVMSTTFIAHVCRIMGTDYTHFSGAQCIVSFVGLASGFLSIRHPHLIKEQPFRITSIVLAVIRGLEVSWWLLLRVRHWLQATRVSPINLR